MCAVCPRRPVHVLWFSIAQLGAREVQACDGRGCIERDGDLAGSFNDLDMQRTYVTMHCVTVGLAFVEFLAGEADLD